MRDLLDFYCKYGMIERVPTHHAFSDKTDDFGSPAFIIPRARENTSGRIIIDYQNLNSLTPTLIPIIPDITRLYHNLYNSVLYSKFDFANAFPSIKISKDSRWITLFVCPLGSYWFKTLPLGLKNAPAIFEQYAQRMLHMLPEMEKGTPIFEKPGIVRMYPARLSDLHSFFDDVLIATAPRATFDLTIKAHFHTIREMAKRIAFHGGKIAFDKAEICKTKIHFLGANIQNNFIIADPKRIERLLQAEMPETIPGWRSWLGLANTLSPILPSPPMKCLQTLYQLTSLKNQRLPGPEHIKAFNDYKKWLSTEPVYAKIIHPGAKKLLFTDASSARNGSYSAILVQIYAPSKEEVYIPGYLNLDDPTHRLVFDKKLSFRPAPIINSLDQLKVFLKTKDLDRPPDQNYQSPLLGYTEENVNDSLFLSTISLQYLGRCKVLTSEEMRKSSIDYVKKTVLQLKLRDFVLNNNKQRYNDFIDNFRTIHGPVDNLLIMIEALAHSLYRPFIVISSLQEHQDQPILKYNSRTEKPPFIYSLYRRSEHLIFLPMFIDRQSMYDLKQHANKLEIVAYHSKTLPPEFANRPIIIHELFAILSALQAFKKYTGDDVTLLCNNKALYLLFNSDVHASSVKLENYSRKLKDDHPRLRIQFIGTKQNISDFLSKRFHIRKETIPKLNLDRFSVSDQLEIDVPTDKDFDIHTWAQFVKSHPEYLRILTEPIETPILVASIERLVKNVDRQLKPISILEERISHSNILKHQRVEFKDLFNHCLASPNFVYKDPINDTRVFRLQHGLILQDTPEGSRILLPEKLQGLFLAYSHLTGGHAGIRKLSLTH